MSRRSFAATVIEEMIREGKTIAQICATDRVRPPPKPDQVYRVRKLYCADLPAPEVVPEPEADIVVAAYLSGERSQTKLAREAGVSRRRVARFLAEARAAGSIDAIE